jgi:hypothetical protein
MTGFLPVLSATYPNRRPPIAPPMKSIGIAANIEERGTWKDLESWPITMDNEKTEKEERAKGIIMPARFSTFQRSISHDGLNGYKSRVITYLV